MADKHLAEVFSYEIAQRTLAYWSFTISCMYNPKGVGTLESFHAWLTQSDPVCGYLQIAIRSKAELAGTVIRPNSYGKRGGENLIQWSRNLISALQVVRFLPSYSAGQSLSSGAETHAWMQDTIRNVTNMHSSHSLQWVLRTKLLVGWE